MRIALIVCFLSLFAMKTCHAQQSRAQVSASVTIVEAIGVTAGATAVTQANGGTLDVTTPLSIRGSAPRVVQVVDGERARPISAQVRPACAPAPSDECAVRARLTPAGPRESTRSLTYRIATVN
ncbi:MAG TPA: hypothetical protein VHG93_20650 [Longimicrobium sp.]|nr:hypothetical protein [Longimicrobium sp.]